MRSKKAGAMGLLRLKYTAGALEGPIAKFLGEGSAGALGLEEGDLALFVAGPDRISSPALDRVRQEVARRMNMVQDTESRFLWVTDFPLFEKDHATGALAAVHHPFTAPNPDDLALLDTAPERV
jgi:aspartyl-tRNA synthetase